MAFAVVSDDHELHRLWLRLERVRMTTWFVLLALPMGLLLTLAIPPAQGLDEANHFYRAYSISDGALVGVHHNGRVGANVPTCVSAYMTLLINRAASTGPFHKSELVKQPTGCNAGQPTFVPFENTAAYSPLPYIPQALAIGAAQLAQAPVPLTFYAGRLAALLTYIVLMLLAFRITPVGGSVFFLLGVWPMSLLQASTYTADTLTIGLAAVLVACLLRCLVDETATWRTFALACVVAGALSLTKITYVVLAPLLFLVPSRVLPTRAPSIIVKIGGMALIGLVSAAWLFQVKDISQAAWFPPGQIDAHQRVSEILHHPRWYAGFILDSMFNGPAGSFTWQSFVAQVSMFRNPVHGPAVPPPWVMVLGYCLLLQAYLRDAGRALAWTAGVITRAALPIVLAVVTTALTFSAVYIESTASHVPPIIGGRYLLPLFTVPLVSLCIMGAGRLQCPSVVPLVPFLLAMYGWLAVRVFVLFY